MGEFEAEEEQQRVRLYEILSMTLEAYKEMGRNDESGIALEILEIRKNMDMLLHEGSFRQVINEFNGSKRNLLLMSIAFEQVADGVYKALRTETLKLAELLD